MKTDYAPEEVEQSAQRHWEENASFRAVETTDKEKFYCLAMFPYPSGKLHMGHVRNYTITDVIARYQKMLGKNVLHPMGWDAFGLPAENAAIQNNSAPAKWTYNNIDYMKQQLKSLGFSFDWSREFATCQADYYKWEQWFFTRLYEKGLVYKKMSAVNWDPIDCTVLANEQVIDGRGWRSGALVERREIPQWFIRITDYADELLEGLDELGEWPEQVRAMQRNWIGKSYGADIQFTLSDTVAGFEQLEVYTTRPDTLMGATYVSIAAEHPIALACAQQQPAIAAFIEECKNKSVAEADMATMEKLGVATGISAKHPITGEELPVWIANYVLMDYGSGAVMAVPAHDKRDFEFATRFNLPIKQVIASTLEGAAPFDSGLWQDWYEAKSDTVTVNSQAFDGKSFQAAFDAITIHLQEIQAGQKTANYRLRDWGVSRQRYWGAPIPMLNMADGGEIPVPLERLPVVLPEDVEMDGVQSPIKADKDWRKTDYNGQAAEFETDTFDTFMESSWYYARFTCPDFSEGILDPERANYWLPVDQYVGGIEHAILHLLYARFFHKLLRDEGFVTSNEPFKRLLCQGMVLAESFYLENADGSKTWISPTDVDIERDEKGRVSAARQISTGEAVVTGGMTKMSKSKNNGIDPQTAINQFGADTVRVFTMFAAPPEQTLEWNDDGVSGAQRFLKRLWKLCAENKQTIQQGRATLCERYWSSENKEPGDEACRQAVHSNLEKALLDFQKNQFNTVIAACMSTLNSLGANDLSDAVLAEGVATLLRVLSPIAPHICHVLWQDLEFGGEIAEANWPEVDASALVQSSVEIVVQINGKVRAKLQVPPDEEKSKVEAAAMANENAQKFIADKQVRKVIVVPNKLINIVVG